MIDQDKRKWLEEQLPDYCFKRLSEADEQQFFTEIQYFPDLMEEVENVKKMFSSLEEIDFRSSYDSKLKNLSFKVVESYSFTKKAYFQRPSFIAMASACFIGVILFGYYSFNSVDTAVQDNLTSQKKSENIFQEDVLSVEKASEIYDAQTLISLDEFEKEIVNSTIESMEPKTAFSVSNPNPMSLPVHSLKTLEENDIVDLLTTLENEDFSL